MRLSFGKVGCVLAGIASLAFVVGVFVLVFFLVRPRGEKVGDTNLMDPQASITLDAKPGDALAFRTDVSLSIATLSFSDDTQRERQLDRLLRTSLLTVRATSSSGAERIATCPIYNGRASTTSTLPGRFSRSGMLNDCSIALDAPGAWAVRGSVEWAPTLTLQSAMLETRRESATK